MKSQEDLYIQESCEKCIKTYIDTGDEVLAEDNLFYALNEIADKSKIYAMNKKKDYFNNLYKSSNNQNKLSNHQMKKLRDFRGESERKIHSAIESKDKGVLTKAKEWLEKKLTWLREWAEDCEDNKSKNIIQRMIAFVIRLIDKIAISIKYVANTVLHGKTIASIGSMRLKWGYKGKSGKIYNHWSNVPEYDKKDEDKGKNKPLFMTD